MKHTVKTALGIAAATALGVVALAWADPQTHGTGPVTKNLQGHAPPSADDPRIRAFYDALVAVRAHGADTVDKAALDQRFREMARKFTPPEGLASQAWEDHVVDMAHQMLEIGKKDPKIFESYESFAIALGGPR
jgi:hypothetical protein